MYQPVITKRSGRYGNNYWYAYSNKIKREVHLFSDLEFENCMLIEADPTIVTFCEQPLKISGFYENKMIVSIFDMWIKRTDGLECFIEVEYSSDLDERQSKSNRIKQSKKFYTK